MAVAVCLVTLVRLFIVGLLVSKLGRLILKSPARKKVLLTVVLSEKVFLKKVSHTLKSPSGGLYITLKIKVRV